MRRLTYLFGLFLISESLVSSLSSAAPAMSLKDYLSKALQAQSAPALDVSERSILFREVELRIGADDEDFKSARFRVSPYGWRERAHQQELTRIESDIYSLQENERSSGRSYEIAKLVVLLQSHVKKLALMKEMNDIANRIVGAYEKNLALLAEKPEDYIQILEDRLQAQEEIQASEYLTNHTQAILAKAADMPAEGFVLNLDGLIALEDIERKVLAWSPEVDSPSLRTKAKLAAKSDLEALINADRQGFGLNYFDVGTGLKNDGQPNSIEFGIGIAIPFYSGEYKAKDFELQSKKSAISTEIELSRLQLRLGSDRLRNQILYRAEHDRDAAVKELEGKIDRIQKRTSELMGSGSIASLHIQLARLKLRIRQHDATSPAWEEFLDLAQLRGELDPYAQIIIASGSLQKRRGE